MSEMTELPEVALWRITWWEPPNNSTPFPGAPVGSRYRTGGTNRTADVVARTLEAAVAAVRAANPTAHVMSVNKVSKTGLFYVAEEARRG